MRICFKSVFDSGTATMALHAPDLYFHLWAGRNAAENRSCAVCHDELSISGIRINRSHKALGLRALLFHTVRLGRLTEQFNLLLTIILTIKTSVTNQIPNY